MSSYTLDVASIPSDKVQALHAYWTGLAAGRAFPRKAEIDPSQIKRLLPYLYISEIVMEPFSVRYRLMGMRVVESWGVDWTGRNMHDGPWTEQSIAEDDERYHNLLRERRPILGLESWTWPWRDRYELRAPYAWAYLPLSDDGETISHCLGIDDTEAVDIPAVAREARTAADLSKL